MTARNLSDLGGELLYVLSDNCIVCGPLTTNALSLTYSGSGDCTLVEVHSAEPIGILVADTGESYMCNRPLDRILLYGKLYVVGCVFRSELEIAKKTIPPEISFDPDELLLFLKRREEELGTTEFARNVRFPGTTDGAARLMYLYLTRPRR